MATTINGHIPVTGDCGHKFDVPLAGLESAFQCPVCGAEDRFSEEQVNSILVQVRNKVAAEAREQVVKSLRNTARRFNRRKR